MEALQKEEGGTGKDGGGGGGRSCRLVVLMSAVISDGLGLGTEHVRKETRERRKPELEGENEKLKE